MDIRSTSSSQASSIPISGQSALPVAKSPEQKLTEQSANGAPAKTPPTREEVKNAVNNINAALQASSQNLEFSIDDDANAVVVKVIDQSTKQVLRQIPTQEALEIAKSLDKVQGLLINLNA